MDKEKVVRVRTVDDAIYCFHKKEMLWGKESEQDWEPAKLAKLRTWPKLCLGHCVVIEGVRNHIDEPAARVTGRVVEFL